MPNITFDLQNMMRYVQRHFYSKGLKRDKTSKQTPGLDDNFLAKQKEAITLVKKYSSRWKVSWFGHHHESRARFTIQKLRNATSIQELTVILQRQKDIFDKNDPTMKLDHEMEPSNARFKEPKRLVNKKKGGFYRAIMQALDVVKEAGVSPPKKMSAGR